MQPSELLQQIIDGLIGILSFEIFISPPLMILGYYTGAVVLPILIYRFIHNYYKKISGVPIPKIDISVAKLSDKVSVKLSPKWIFLLGFIAFEVFWRIFFEFILAYFQIRDALVSLGLPPN